VHTFSFLFTLYSVPAVFWFHTALMFFRLMTMNYSYYKCETVVGKYKKSVI